MQELIEKLCDVAKKHPLYKNVVATNGRLVLGKGKKESPEILFIGEAAGFSENAVGIPFVGKSGQILEQWIRKHHLEMQYAVINAIPMIPLDEHGKIRKPTSEEIAYFRPYVLALIKKINPKMIICIGKTAAECLEIDFINKNFVENIGCIYHPSYYLRNNSDGQSDFDELMKNIYTTKDNTKQLKTQFVINRQTAENIGQVEMTSPIIAGLHFFAKQAKIYFFDKNQKDECILGKQNVKIYTRDVMMDEDMLIHENYFQAHPEINIYIMCKVLANQYIYIGYITKEIVADTRIVTMFGEAEYVSTNKRRRIFSDQYLPISDLIKIHEKVEQENNNIVLQKFVPLCIHSEYSIGKAFGTIKQIAETLYKNGFKTAAITDLDTLSSVWHFQKALLERDIKPILGIDASIVEKIHEESMHLKLFVKDAEGWRNLLCLHTNAVRKYFYYHPNILLSELLQNASGLICLVGSNNSKLYHLVSRGQITQAHKHLEELKSAFGDDLYIQITLLTINSTEYTTKNIIAIADEMQIKCCLANEVFYPMSADKGTCEALLAIHAKKQYGQIGFVENLCYLLQEEEIHTIINGSDLKFLENRTADFLANTNSLAEKCDFKFTPTKEKDTLPKFLPQQDERKQQLKELCIAGLAKYTPYKYDGIIKERLDLEMDRILAKDYENYFLIVWDLVKWAKENNIRVGAGRGSIGSSLCALALNITECDPIKFDLLFDRFLSPIRRDMPDADIDFMDHRREEVCAYLQKKYGQDNCVKVITYARFHPKGVLKDIGRIFNIPYVEVEQVSKTVIERTGGDARNSLCLADTFNEFEVAKKFKFKYKEACDIAIKLEGHIRHKSIHAAAIVIAEMDLGTYIPITKIKGEYVTEWEKQLVEDAKLIKLDILGLKNLSIIEDAKVNANCELPKTFDDIEVYNNVFANGNTIGIFQFETVGLAKLAQSIKVSRFSELCDCTALYRPSTLHAGTTSIYINRAQGKEEIKPFHPLLADITQHTKGIIIYQEQVMKVMNQIGGMSWAAAETVRKIITKSKGQDAFKKMREEFIRNASTIHTITTDEAAKIFDTVSMFGSYGFNQSHSVAYSILSYQCAWLKHYYPVAFYYALLKNEQDSNSLFKYMQDAEQYGIKIQFPVINKSKTGYTMIDNKIYAGFNCIKGIAEKTAEKIIFGQPYDSYEDFVERTKISKTLLTGLIISDAFREFSINKRMKISLLEGKLAFGNDDYDENEYCKLVFRYTTLQPNKKITDIFNFGEHIFTDINKLDQEQHENQQILIRGIVTGKLNKDKFIYNNLIKHVHQFERHLIYLNIADSTGNIAVLIKPWTYEFYQKELINIERKPVIAFGILSRDKKKMYCDMLQVQGVTNGIEQAKASKNTIITSAVPAYSKNGKSYYRIILNDGQQGLLFQFNKKVFVGQKCTVLSKKGVFFNLKIDG